MSLDNFVLAAATSLGGVAASSAQTMPIPALVDGLYNTGVTDTGVLLATGDSELHYAVTGPIGTSQVIVPNGAWVTDTAAKWIGPVNGTANAPVGSYSYTLSFDLSQFDVNTVVIDGLWASDNDSMILLNGNATGFSDDSLAFQDLESFTLTSGFVSGLNTLTFQVNNPGGPSPNPTGLLVTGLSGNGLLIPEPGSMLLLSSGGLLLLRARRRG